MPASRMGEGWLFRKKFKQAQDMLHAQEDWCSTALFAVHHYPSHPHLHISKRYPVDLKLESLVALLRGEVRLQVHCYETHDIEMMLRLKNEFGFNIVAFHHASEAYLVADRLKKENISVAIFADHSLYKKEACESIIFIECEVKYYISD